MNIAVYYDFHENGIYPITMVIGFEAGELDWNESTLVVPLETPFKRFMLDEFDDDCMSISILLSDLIVNLDKHGHFGINIPAVRKRHQDVITSLYEVSQLNIRICDIEDVLQMSIRKYCNWR